MVELVSQRTDLRRAGGQWSGLCPFHEERSPSFSVNAESKVYYCFGCQEKGDAIRFIEQTEGLDFPGAIEYLAERYNVELKRENEDPQAEQRRRRRERLMALLERAASYYARVLWESEEGRPAREYLTARGLEEETLRGFSVGYSPSAGDRIARGAQRDGFTPAEVAAAGLGREGRDPFRARITFPLTDARGRVLGFGARATSPEQKAKYINTAENEVYKKGRQLFGIEQARAPAARAGRVVVVEGYTDVLALHQAGVKETVAIMGTALTEDQLKELTRAVGRGGRIYLALDADRSGLEAMQRAADMSPELELRVVPMPAGSDPADLIAADGPEGFTGLLEKAMSIPEFRVRRLVAGVNPTDPPAVDAALAGVRDLLVNLAPNSATRVSLLSFVADQLGVPPHLVTTAAPPRTSGATAHRASEPSFDSIDHERGFLAACLAQPNLGRRYLEELRAEHFTSTGLWDAGRWIRENFDAPLSGLPSDDPELVAEVGRVVSTADQREFSEGDVRSFFLGLEQRKTQHLLRLAERQGNFEDAERLQMKLQEIRKQAEAVSR